MALKRLLSLLTFWRLTVKRIRPTGFRVLIKIDPVEEVSAGGIITMSMNEAKREHVGRDVGTVVEFGPTCYLGYEGCKGPEDWCKGLKVGSSVEFNRYNGKESRYAERYEHLKDYRIINDGDIIAVLEDAAEDKK
jgi:co-chaperonin GroES (HSP10)